MPSPASFQANAWVFTMRVPTQLVSNFLPTEGKVLLVYDKSLAELMSTDIEEKSFFGFEIFCR